MAVVLSGEIRVCLVVKFVFSAGSQRRLLPASEKRNWPRFDQLVSPNPESQDSAAFVDGMAVSLFMARGCVYCLSRRWFHEAFAIFGRVA
jgi:hypothetical protein